MPCGQVFDENGKVKLEFILCCAGDLGLCQDPITPQGIAGEYINANPQCGFKETMKVVPCDEACICTTLYYDCCPCPIGCTPYCQCADDGNLAKTTWLGLHPLCFFQECISHDAEGLWYHNGSFSLCFCCVSRERWDKVPEDDELYEAIEATKEETAWNTLVGSPVFGGNSPADAIAVPRAKSKQRAIHPGAICDLSGMSPIIGTRYHKMGEDFDVCETEFKKLPVAEKAKYESIVGFCSDTAPRN
eukprot:gene7686-4350_t